MASSFAAQLRSIAQNSTHELDLRARRDAHAESLLFPKEVAVKQNFDTLYAVCIEGFQELCSLDKKFVEFERNLFSNQSVRTEREQISKSDNEALDKVLERCLAMLGGRLLLKPGIRCLEWLVRRFRVHTNNTSALLLAVLPWHEMSIWRNVLNIIPKEKCAAEWKFLGMYKEEVLNIPRTAICYALTNNDGFFALLNRYVVDAARDGLAHAGLLKFWTGLVAEAVVGRLDATRSGRKEVQRQRTEDLLLKILPLLSDGFEVRGCPDMTTACFTLAMVLAGKADLDDRVLDSLLYSVASTANFTEKRTALITIMIIVGQKEKKSLPKAALDIFMNLPNLEGVLSELHKSYPIDSLIQALMIGALSSVKQKHIATRLAFVERILRFSSTLTQQVVDIAAQTIMLKVFSLRMENQSENMIRAGLIEMLRRLNEERSISLAISQAAQKLNQDPSQVEALLGSTVALVEANPDASADIMEIDTTAPVGIDIDGKLEKTPTRTVDSISFLGRHSQNLYEQLVDCFTACSKYSTSLLKFISLPIWETSQSGPLLLGSFLLRVAIDSSANASKYRALESLEQLLLNTNHEMDTQALLPYVLTALSDPAQHVRKSAANLLITMEKLIPAEDEPSNKLGFDNLYDTVTMQDIKWIPASHVKKIIGQAFFPVLEECVLDASQIALVIKSTLSGSDGANQTPRKSPSIDLKKSFRHDLFELLTSHAIATPVFRLKVTTIHYLDGVYKVGVTTKSKALAPLLQSWTDIDETQAKQIAEAEHLSVTDVDEAMMEIISSQDKDAIGHFLAVLENSSSAPRTALVTTFFDRVQKLWKELKPEIQVANAIKLFDLAFQSETALSNGAQGALRSVSLTTHTLGTILDQCSTGITQMENEEQPKKKRRTSHGRESQPPVMAQLIKNTTARLTLALELTDDAQSHNRPELLVVLFDILSTLRRLQQQHKMNLPYLHNLCLGNILTIVEAQKSLPKPLIDKSSIRPDLIIDCIRFSDNPQVQTTALLLSASLASIVPEQMLHHVMPIFTFMGQNMFSRDDEHSVHVTNQAIDAIVPALIGSLKAQDKEITKSIASLLASFTAAFDHIPQSRRVATYARLLDRMGADEFAFILIAMLAQRKSYSPAFDTFFSDLLAGLNAKAHLLTYQQLIKLANDLLSSKPKVAEDILGIVESESHSERQRLSGILFKCALKIIKSKTLKVQTNRLHKLDDETAQALRFGIDSCFRLTLSTIRDLRQAGDTVIVEEAKKCLDALLAMPSLIELFVILPQALRSEEIEEDLKPQTLRVLATQLQNNPSKDSKTREAAMTLLNQFTEMLQVEPDFTMRQAIIVCMDQISEVYGRKEKESVVLAASVVAGNECLGSSNHRLQVMSLLCLASMLEIIKEDCIPLVPDIMQKIIFILQLSVQPGSKAEEAHNAAFALAAAIASHVPFLISDEDIQSLLFLSSKSTTIYLSATAVESRNETLTILARKLEFSSLVTALLGEDLDVEREHPEIAEIEKLEMFSIALEAASKVDATKNADATSQLLLSHLDQRGRFLSAGRDLSEAKLQAIHKLEEKIRGLSIQFIYKLNDTSFRPIFESWVEWASQAYDVDDPTLRDEMKTFRCTSLFGLLTHFFDSLKSIVTSYASYILAISNEILTDYAGLADSTKIAIERIDSTLYTELLGMLRATFMHDADSFYTNPSHFEPIAIPLVSQLKLASSKALRNQIYRDVVPTIVSFATATLETPSHHQLISHALVQLRHSSSAAVRLASIKTLAAITEDDDVGDEFIANVVGIGSGEGEGARGIGGGGSVGEVMIYVNEMLEDDDENVEREVRKWVQAVREKTGEDVFEV